MKIIFSGIFMPLLLSTSIFASEVITEECRESELKLSLAQYYYCTNKSSIQETDTLNGKNQTIYVKTQYFEYSFSKLPISLALLDLPNKLKLTNSDFFNQLTDRGFKKNKFPKIRQAFEITEYTIISRYDKSTFTAISIINKSVITNSIYIFNKVDDFIFVVKGNFNKMFADKFISKLKTNI